MKTGLLDKPRTATGRVLVVDDHGPARQSLSEILRHAGHRVEAVASAVEALRRLADESFDVVITDLNMPGMTGLQFLEQLARRRHGAEVLMVTAYASVGTAVEAMRHGAFDYIEKPFTAEQIENLVARALERGRLTDARQPLAVASVAGAPCMIGESRPMQSLKSQIARVAPTNETVLILGESGTGKELIARAIHAQSARAAQPLVSVNCPVLATQLTESELFGHERGAFTGAEAPRTGRFELAHRGSIHLDEVTEIDLGLQAKLLRVLQERTIERVGSSETLPVDVRVIASSNRDLRQWVREGRFREDLYFRLAVVPLTAPPLRERREDVPALARHFLDQAAARLEREPLALSPGAEELLCGYAWPGNVRELENLLRRAAVLAGGGELQADELRPWLLEDARSEDGPAGPRVGARLEEMERELIEATLAHFDGHRAKTAEALGIGVRTLSGKLKDYGYAPRSKPSAA